MLMTNTNYQRHKLMIAGCLFLYTLSIFLPGAYSIDSWNQWREVTSTHFDDWYGTGLVTTWRALWIVTGNYMCLYVAQMFVYWTFITFILWQVPFKSVIYWLTLAIALFYCMIPQYVMRDSLSVLAWGMAALLLLYGAAGLYGAGLYGAGLYGAAGSQGAAGGEIHHRRGTIRRGTILALLLLAYGVWVRINAIAAFLPLAYACIVLVGGRPLVGGGRLAGGGRDRKSVV